MGDHVSRRQVLGVGAVGLGAAALSGLSLDAALAEGMVPSGPPTLEGAGGGPLVAPPPTVPGARIGVVNYTDMSAFGLNGADPRFAAFGGLHTDINSLLGAPLELPVGSRLVRVDTYVRTASTAVMQGGVIRSNFLENTITLVNPFSQSGSGVFAATYVPSTPHVVGLGERYYVNCTSATDASHVFMGVLYQYFDPNPQLNILGAPVRIYDSRPADPPLGVTKGPLANGASRVIDAKQGSAVPAGAAAALVTLTVTNTSAAGFVSLFKNGIAWPGTSTINWASATTVATTTVVALDAVAQLKAYVSAGSSTDLIVDVLGFYA